MSVIVTCPRWCTTIHLGADKPIEHDGPRCPTVEGVIVVRLDAAIGQ